MKITTTLTPANSALTISGSVLSVVTLLSKAGPPGVSGTRFFANFAAFPVTGTTDLLYVDKSNGKAYIWSVDHYAIAGGSVDSVNGQTGAVSLDAADVGAEPTGAVAALAGTLGTAAYAATTDFEVAGAVSSHVSDTTPHETIHNLKSIAPNLAPGLVAPYVVGQRFWDADNHCWATVARVDGEGAVASLQQDGQELPMYWRNDDNVTHYNGQPVYVAGGTGKRAKVKLSSASNYSTATTIALATEDVGAGALGRYTTFGNVSDIPTAQIVASTDSVVNDWTEGADVYLSEEVGKLTVFPPEGSSEVVKVGNVTEIVGNAAVTIFFSPDNRTAHMHVEATRADTKEPSGFPNRTDSTATFASSTSRTLTIAPTGTEYSYWVKGVKHTSTGHSVEHPNTAGVHYFYIDENEVLQTTMTPVDILAGYALVGGRYWNGTKGTNLADGRHGLSDLGLHNRLHNVEGAVWDSEFGGGELDVTGNYSHLFSVTRTKFFDEDLQHDTEGVLTTAHRWYGDGDVWFWDDVADAKPYYTPSLYDYNLYYYNTSTATLAQLSNNYYTNSFLFHTNLGGTEKLAWVIGRAKFSTFLAALEELPVAPPFGGESVCLQRITLKVDGSAPIVSYKADWRGTPANQLPLYMRDYLQSLTRFAYPDFVSRVAGIVTSTVSQLPIQDGSPYVVAEDPASSPFYLYVTVEIPVTGVVSSVHIVGRFTGINTINVGPVDNLGNHDILGTMPKSQTSNSPLSITLDDAQHRVNGYVKVRFQRAGGGAAPNSDYKLILDQVRVEYAASGLQASRIAVPAYGSLAGLTVEAQLKELADEKAPALGADDNYVTDAEKAALHAHADFASLEAASQDTKEPAGFPTRTECTVAFASSTSRTLTITPTATDYSYWVKGAKHTSTGHSVEHPNTVGLHYFYIDESEVLQTTMTPWNILDGYAFVGIRYWNGTKGTTVGEERHGLRDLRLHNRLHSGGGAVWDSQFNGGELTVSGASGDTWSLTRNKFFDEDLQHDTGGTLTTAHRWYGDGSPWVWDDTAVTTPYFTSGGVIQFYSTNSAALVTASENYYVNVFLFHTNLDGTERLAWVMGDSQFLHKLDAMQETPTRLPIGQEGICLYRLTYQAGAASTTFVAKTNWRGTPHDQLPPSVALYSQTVDIYAYPDQATVSAGTPTGVIGNLTLVDGSTYIITETAGANPAIDITLRIPVDGVVTAVNLTGRYTGSGTHQIEVGAVDSGAAFDVLSNMPRSATTNSTITLPLDDAQHRYGGYVYVKLRHNSVTGIGSHQLILDQVRVEYAASGLQASRVSVPAYGSLAGLTVEAQLKELADEKAPALGADDNYVTDAEKAALHTHSNKTALDAVSGVNTGDQDISGKLDNPLTTRGDIIYQGVSGPARLAKGTPGQVLTMGADDPAWAASAGGGEIDWANPIAVTGATTLTIGKVHVCTGTTYTVTLPAASGNAGKSIALVMAAGLAGLVTVDGNASETINGALTRVMHDNETAELWCDGTTWTKVAGKSIPMNCSMSRNTGQTIATGTFTNVQVNTFDSGVSAMADTGNYRLNILRSNNYRVTSQVFYTSAAVLAAKRFDVRVHKNAGSTTIISKLEYTAAANTFPSPFITKAPISLTAGDYLNLVAYHENGTNVDLLANAAAGLYVSVEELISW